MQPHRSALRRARAAAVLATLLMVAILPQSAHAEIVGHARSTLWRGSADGLLRFPEPPGTTIPEYPYYAAQLPATVRAGDLVQVNAAAEFSNKSSWNTSGDPWKVTVWDPFRGWTKQRSERWTMPIMGSCGLWSAPADPGDPLPTSGWETITHPHAENWDAVAHHWRFIDIDWFIARAATAGDWVALRCRFARNVLHRDPYHDFVKGETTYGRVSWVVIR
jgi:hypothetical protein